MTDLIPLYKQMTVDGAQFQGLSILKYVDDIKKLVQETQSKTILDYGCGRGDAYKPPHRIHRIWGIKWWDVILYDPAFKEHCDPPLNHWKFDGVLCSDVIEHVPEELVPALIGTLFHHARKFVWASVCCRPAKKTFPDGVTNLHVTLQPYEWWKAKFDAAAEGTTLRVQLVESP